MFNLTQFAYFLKRLSEVRDGDGPLLDTTLALYGSGLSYGNSHGTTSLPLVLAGGSGLGVKHEVHVDYNQQGQSFQRLWARRGRVSPAREFQGPFQ